MIFRHFWTNNFFLKKILAQKWPKLDIFDFLKKKNRFEKKNRFVNGFFFHTDLENRAGFRMCTSYTDHTLCHIPRFYCRAIVGPESFLGRKRVSFTFCGALCIVLYCQYM